MSRVVVRNKVREVMGSCYVGLEEYCRVLGFYFV